MMIDKKTMQRSFNDSLRVSCRRRRRARTDKKLVAAGINATRNEFSRFNAQLRNEMRKRLLPRLLPRPKSPGKKTIFLDLDNTLVHSSTAHPKAYYDFAVHTPPTEGNESVTWYVQKRPGVDEFLAAISRNYEVVAFTAANERYASLVLDQLDPARTVFSYRLYRDSCTMTGFGCLKELWETGRDARRAVIVDDQPTSSGWKLENVVPVKPYLGGQSDKELHGLIKFFKHCHETVRVDMRDAAARGNKAIEMGLGAGGRGSRGTGGRGSPVFGLRPFYITIVDGLPCA